MSLKRYTYHYILYTLLFTALFLSAKGQEGNIFNLNINNGLPANHVYSVITDRHGYLWIATTNGVLRYNGYEFKTFTVSDGLPTDDVWQLMEDRKGRIWLGSIADKIGYIYNEKYHSAVFADTNYHTVYPRLLSVTGNNIMFTSSYLINNHHPIFCIEQNDTIYTYNVVEKLKEIVPEIEMEGEKIEITLLVLNHDMQPIITYNNKYYTFSCDKKGIQIKYLCEIKKDLNVKYELGINPTSIVNNYMFNFSFHKKEYFVKTINVNTGEIKLLDLKKYTNNETIISAYHNGSNRFDNNIFAITKSYLIQLDLKNEPKYVNTYKIDNISGLLDGSKINSYITDSFWKTSISTRDNGLFIKYDTTNYFRRSKIELSDYRYIGGDENEGFWINSANKLICRISNKVEYFQAHELGNVNRIQKKDNNNYLILGSNNHRLNTITKKTYLYPDTSFGSSVFSVSMISPKRWYCISNFDFYYVDPVVGTKYANEIDKDRFKGLIYDSLRKMHWAYNRNKILIYQNGKKTPITKHQLNKYGVKSIDKICLDNKYGNIFIKGSGKVIMYDYNKEKYTELHTDYNLKEASISIYKNQLITYGRFGVIFTKILGSQTLSAPIVYKNIKNTNFNYIKDAQFAFDKAILNTDKGVYEVDIPVNSNSYMTTNLLSDADYKFVYYYKENIFNLKSRDTIKVNQKDLRIRFDLINPYGNGDVKYIVSYKNVISELNSNEFALPSQFQSPDNYYSITLSAYDKVWRSKPVHLVIYIKPYWWQTKKMIVIIWIAASLFIILLFTASILITRRLVLRASKKRNLQMEIELKAIYSQINPHFIFNSLNSALLLVSKNKMEEAYTHISKFSRLLRSYIKSSRNKLVTIDEEILNLSNYIELQQVRFKEKFNYTIKIDKTKTSGQIKIPSLLLQPFVENAINHGLLAKEETGNLSIEFKISGNADKLFCIIEDDGVGRKQSRLINEQNISKDESYGDILIKDLITIFNKYEDMNISVSYIDKELPLSGTVVTIEIKYERNA